VNRLPGRAGMRAVWVVRPQRGWAAVQLASPEHLATRARWAAPATRARQEQRVSRVSPGCLATPATARSRARPGAVARQARRGSPAPPVRPARSASRARPARRTRPGSAVRAAPRRERPAIRALPALAWPGWAASRVPRVERLVAVAQASRVVRQALAEPRRGAAGVEALGRARPPIARTAAAMAARAFANAPLRSAAPPGQPARPAAGVSPATRWGSAGSTPCRSGRSSAPERRPP
jgi:hypothetical protein